MKKYFWSCLKVAVFCAVGMVTKTWAQADYMPPMSGWPAAAQTSWQIQGEYYGEVAGGGTLGAWLIANGNNAYTVVFLPGGLLDLPGQPYGGWVRTGWSRSTFSGSASLSGTTYTVTTTSGYKAAGITGTGEARVMTGTTPTNAAFTLNRVVRKSPTVRLKPATAWGATSWFDSSTGQADVTAKWASQDNAPSVKYNYLYRGGKTVATHGAMFLHIEFLSCYNPTATGQGRGNSGIYLQSHYEVQVLDSFGLTGAIDEFGAIYSVRAPNINASLPPLTLHTYDVYFTPRTSGTAGSTAGSAYMTVYANGVLTQDSVLVPNVTTAGVGGSLLVNASLYTQNHGNEVVFNNIWMVPNATVHTLPWESVLAQAGVTTTSINHYQIKPLLGKKNMSVLGVNGLFDLTGRKILRQGKVLAIQPLVSPKSK